VEFQDSGQGGQFDVKRAHPNAEAAHARRRCGLSLRIGGTHREPPDRGAEGHEKKLAAQRDADDHIDGPSHGQGWAATRGGGSISDLLHPCVLHDR
jgi:hypothetical protein